MLPGRLGLETARLPHSDRHGLVSLDRGRLTVEEGCLTFDCAGGGVTPAGRYGLPRINSFRLSCWAPDRASATTCCASSPGTEWGWWRPARTACASIPRNRCCQTSPTSPAPTGCNGDAARTMSTATPLRNAQGAIFSISTASPGSITSVALYFRCTSAEACPRIYSRASSPT